MTVNQFDHDIFTSNSLLELHIPFYRLKILEAPKDWVTIKGLQAKCSLNSFRVTYIYFEGYVLILSSLIFCVIWHICASSIIWGGVLLDRESHFQKCFYWIDLMECFDSLWFLYVYFFIINKQHEWFAKCSITFQRFINC